MHLHKFENMSVKKSISKAVAVTQSLLIQINICSLKIKNSLHTVLILFFCNTSLLPNHHLYLLS